MQTNKTRRKPKDNRKKLFTVLGEVKMDGDKKKFAFNSPAHYLHFISKLPEGKKLGVTFEEYKATRSEQQLAYHWVLMTYIAEHTGHEPYEIHELVMRAKFGTRKIKVGDIEQEVRKSISESARMPLADCVELITFDLELCRQLEIRVPTKQELGYIDG